MVIVLFNPFCGFNSLFVLCSWQVSFFPVTPKIIKILRKSNYKQLFEQCKCLVLGKSTTWNSVQGWSSSLPLSSSLLQAEHLESRDHDQPLVCIPTPCLSSSPPLLSRQAIDGSSGFRVEEGTRYWEGRGLSWWTLSEFISGWLGLALSFGAEGLSDRTF